MTATALGREFQINTFTENDQDSPAIAMDAQGNFVVTWESDEQDGDKTGIFAQRFNARGRAVGDEFRVNTTTDGKQDAAAIAMNASGEFVIVWEDDEQDGSGEGVYAQRFSADGDRVGPEFRVNTSTQGNQDSPKVAIATDGRFVVVWTGDDGDESGVFAQRFSSNGTPLGDEILINTEIDESQDGAAIAMDADGNFVVTWESEDQDGDRRGIFAQRFDADGVAIGDEFQVNTETSGNQDNAAIALGPNGEFVVVWESDDQDKSGSGIYGQRFDADGNALGSEFQVNSTGGGNQIAPAIAIDADGNFMVTWSNSDQDGDKRGVYGRHYGSNGQPIGSEFLINTETENSQNNPAIATTAAGDTLVVWESIAQDGDDSGIFGQRFSIEPGRNTDNPGDAILGDRQDNVLKGTTGDDLIKGKGGDDVLKGRAGEDKLKGGGGDDLLVGGRDADILAGGGGSDTLRGGGAGDKLKGGSGDDTLRGNGGSDQLIGGSGDDALLGGGGDDVLTGGAGDDELFGEGGRDRFTLEIASGTDTILDFKSGSDLLVLKGGLTFGDLSFERQGSTTLIRATDSDLAILQGVRPNEITVDDVVVA
ncbi:MAG: hypothetical protein WBA57_06645 [Elainellaceae cyanobacterium]